MKFGNPVGGTASSIGTQIINQYYQKKALIGVLRELYFSQLADVASMPKNMGKTIKRYLYLPVLSDSNINDQGIDAAGAVIDSTKYYATLPNLVDTYAVSANADAAVAAINAIEAGVAVKTGSVTPWAVTVSKKQLIAATQAQSDAVVAAVPGSFARQASGNLYGRSKDIGTIAGKLPVLSENGGRVNRVGFKRKELVGTLTKFGFFDEYTQETMDFDTDAELAEHINREMIRAATYMTEDALQVDLVTQASVIRYAGSATSNITCGETSLVSYSDLMRMSIDLDQNRCPKKTTVITGTRMVDTKTIPACRVIYMGSELLPTVKAMKDLHNNPAFISVEKYAGSGGDTFAGEVGAIDHFRLIVVPEMTKWAGAGADSTASVTSYSTNGRYDVFPMLCVGEESFATIGFQTDGQTVKFKITHRAPGEENATTLDPFGETGFMSIKWYYGFMVLRSERLALLKTVGRL
jgi:N4-gp56 family major capsid protein